MKNYDCVRCKGTRMLCGRNYCPRVEKAKAAMREVQVARQMHAPSPTVFIGRIGYPKVFSGPMITKYWDPEITDSPEKWYGTPLEQLSSLRYQLVRTKEPLNVKTASQPSYDLMKIQDIAMSSKSVATETVFRKQPSFNRKSFNEITAPYGPSGELSQLDITENPKVPRKVDKVVSDDLKAVEGAGNLYENDIPVSRISRIFSVGLLGQEKNRRLVPTRWSITATDDIVGKKLVEEIKDYKEVNEYLLFSDTYLGNHFEVLLVPGNWSFENIEVYVPGSIWVDSEQELRFMKDWEPYRGRTTYADNVAGAYYSCRLACAEYLKKQKRQATVIAVREVTPDYWCPMGVWVIRETVRKTFQKEPVQFDTLGKALQELRERLMTGKNWEKESELLPRLKSREVFKQYLGKG